MAMPRCEIDHLVISAPDLASGIEHVRQRLGAAPQPGGKHARLGTHNCVLKLGESSYLEVIAPDPDAPKPDRPRWFELDRVPAPRLATWVARTTDIHATVTAASEPLGPVEPMSRGSLRWLITIPADGTLPLGGTAPALIEWKTKPHPASALLESGCSLLRLEAFHPDATRVSALLESIGVEGAISVSPLSPGSRPYVVGHILTAHGTRTI